VDAVKTRFVSAAAIEESLSARQGAPLAPDQPLAEPVLAWLARLRLLHDVPFEYLVADDLLLPPESIRFFNLDRNWTDAAVAGALAAGVFTVQERAQLAAGYAAVRDALDETERNQWQERVGGPRLLGAGEVVTGFLLRSRAVSGWPGLHVTAVRREDGAQRTLSTLRLERLAPAVLLVLVDGVPTRVEISEPRQGVQFGVDPPDPGDPPQRRYAVAKDPATGHPIAPRVRVRYRAGSPGVIAVDALRARLLEAHASQLGTTLSPAEYALQMLQFPYRQLFGEPAGGPVGFVTLFAAAALISEVRAWYAG
jgi:hypothetical protein